MANPVPATVEASVRLTSQRMSFKLLDTTIDVSRDLVTLDHLQNLGDALDADAENFQRLHVGNMQLLVLPLQDQGQQLAPLFGGAKGLRYGSSMLDCVYTQPAGWCCAKLRFRVMDAASFITDMSLINQ